MKPKPFPIPEGTPIQRFPPGVAAGSTQKRFAVGDPDHRRTTSKGLLRAVVRCEKCGADTSRMLNRRQLKNARIKCDACGANVGFSCDAVRRG